MKVAICDDSEQDIADLKEKLLRIIEGQIENLKSIGLVIKDEEYWRGTI